MSPGCWRPCNAPRKYLRWNHRDTFTRLMSTGTSTRGPTTAANACPEPIPNTATATAMAGHIRPSMPGSHPDRHRQEYPQDEEPVQK